MSYSFILNKNKSKNRETLFIVPATDKNITGYIIIELIKLNYNRNVTGYMKLPSYSKYLKHKQLMNFGN